VKSKDPAALAAWYHDMLGIKMEPWGGAMLRYDAPLHPAVVVWNAVPNSSKYMAPSTRDFMLDFGVDNLDAIIARLKAKGVSILKRDDSDPDGKFAWVLDPDGTKIELWQAKKH
jgi:predicted enzyme related to lactoylglutathione lyase